MRHFVETQGRRTLREQLKGGYCVNTERDLAIAAGWFPLDEEASRTFEAAREPERIAKPNGLG